MNEETLFHLILEKPVSERAVFLDEACGNDAALRRRIEVLLQAHEHPASFLKSSVVATECEATLDPPNPLTPAGIVIGRYKLLEPIGEGGYGTVFMAEQTSPVQRKVALKIIKAGMDTRQVIARFEAERQALALMDHPNIAKVFDAGVTDAGRPYFVMELVKGVSIIKYCDEHHLPPRARLELFVQVCQAVQHAHTKGIIHRDLKPSNVLIALYDGKPVPKVIDFGVAKATGQQLTERTMFTAFGDLIGTLEYMSPEQAEMNQLDVDTRSDIYSLGVLLYELLTGSTPLENKRIKQTALMEVLKFIREEEPQTPSIRLMTAEQSPGIAANRGMELKKLSGLVHGELDWIVMKSLEKDRGRRYETANGLAADVRRYLDDEAVQAHPPSATYRMRKLAYKHRAALTIAAGFVLLLASAAVVSTWQAVRATHAEALAHDQRALASRSADDANSQRAVAEVESRRAKEQGARANEQASLARRRLYAAQINLAYQSWEAGNAPRVLELLEGQRPKFDKEDLRTFEWYHLWGLCQPGRRFTLRGHTGTIRVIAFSPDGKTLASASHDATVRLWNVATGQERFTLRAHQGTRAGVAFSPDGKMLVTGGEQGHVKVWDVTTGKEMPIRFPEQSMEEAVVFSPDGKTLAGGNFHGLIRLWDVATWKEKARIQLESGRVKSLAFSPDGKMLASAAEWGDTRARLWDVTADPPRLVREFPGHRTVALSPDGKSLAVTHGYGEVKLYDVATGEERASYPGLLGAIYSVAFSRDGKRLAFGTQNRSARIWDPTTGAEQTYPHLSPVGPVAFSPDGNVFASASEDGVIKVWDMNERPAAAGSPMVKGCRAPVFSPDGSTLAFISPKPSVELFEMASGQRRSIPAPEYKKAWLTYAPNGKTLAQLATSGFEGVADARLYDVRSGQELATFKVRCLAFSPDGKSFATADESRPALAQVWDLDTKQPRARLKSMPHSVVSVLAFSPDSKTLAGGGSFGFVKLWDATTGEERASFQEYLGGYHWLGCLAFTPDGKLLATGNWDGSVKLWEVSTRQLRATLKGHTALVSAMAFFPDGKTLVTASEDRTLKFWDVATAQERMTCKGHSSNRFSFTIAPDGTTLAALTEDGTITFRRAVMDSEAVVFQSEMDPDDPESPVAQNNMGDRFRAHGRPQDAERAYRQALSRLEQLTSRFPQHEEYLERLIYSQFALSVLLRSSNRREEAETVGNDLAKAVKRSSNAGNQNGMAWHLATDPDPACRNPKLAVELAESAITIQPGNAQILNTLGAARYRNGQWRGAIAALEKSMELRDGGDSYDWFFLAMSHWQLGEHDEARRWYAQAVRWMEKQERQDDGELRRFQTETEELLSITQRKPTTKVESK